MGHTRCSGYRLSDENMDAFACSYLSKVVKMPNFDSADGFNGQNEKIEPANESPRPDEDLLMEQILDNINTTPIGQVLKKIAMLPEVRAQKVLNVRQQLTEGEYDLNERLDVALDKVLEDLVTQ